MLLLKTTMQILWMKLNQFCFVLTIRSTGSASAPTPTAWSPAAQTSTWRSSTSRPAASSFQKVILIVFKNFYIWDLKNYLPLVTYIDFDFHKVHNHILDFTFLGTNFNFCFQIWVRSWTACRSMAEWSSSEVAPASSASGISTQSSFRARS